MECMNGAVRAMAFAVSAGAMLAAHGFEVVENDGRFTVRDGGKVVVSAISAGCADEGTGLEVKRSHVSLGDGTEVWNQWCEARDGRYRLEVARHPNGEVEVTMMGEVDPFDHVRKRCISVELSDVLSGADYKALEGNGRSWTPKSGKFDGSFAGGNFRWLAAGGLTFDLNPLGAGDYCSGYQNDAVRGVWSLRREGKGLRLDVQSNLTRTYGGYTGAKLVLRKGRFEDYDRIHFLRSYRYANHLAASRRLAFGSPKRGECYAEGDVDFAEDRKHGWQSGAEGRRTIIGHGEGALYSAVAGSGRAVYRFADLPDGYYLFTVEAGNYTGAANSFGVSVNGAELAARVSVAPRTARAFSRAVHVQGGCADVALDGDWLVSAMGVQPVLGDAEDYSVKRGLWVTEGFEPTTLYRSADYGRPVEFKAADETYELPEPGTETAAKPRDPPAPVELPDPRQESLSWLEGGKIDRIVSNASSLSCADDPERLSKYIGAMSEGRGYSALMVSGMHSRHTYPAHLDRGVEAIRRIAAETHRRGMKLLDHHDATLLWNIDSGLRVLMERVPELIRSYTDGLPSFQLCPCNDEFNEKYYGYLRRLVEAGVDGFQIDELEFWSHGCVCEACRKRFFRETGWKVPANECDKAFRNPNSPLRRRWHDWRVKTVTNWFIELRRRLKDIKPDLVLTMYTTHWGFSYSLPRRGGSNDLIDLGRTVNYFGTEVMTRNVMKSARALPPLRKAYNLLNVGYGTPIWGWYYSSNAKCDYFAWALANMHGQTALLSDPPPDAEAPDYIGFGGSRANMRRAGARAVAQVALLFSGYSRDWNAGCSSVPDLLGTAQTLEELHVPYEMIGDMSVTDEALAKYKVLYVGASHCLSDAEVAAIRRFAERGGSVYLRALAGTCDEFGVPRAKWAFGDIFGFKPAVRAPSIAEDARLGKGTVRYSSALPGEGLCFREFMLGKTCAFSPDPVLAAQYREELAKFTEKAAFWKVDAPPMVYTTLWREQDGKLVAHFLNATGCEMHAGDVCDADAPVPPFPDLAKDIVFTVPGLKMGKAVAYSPDLAWGGRQLKLAQNGDGTVTVTLPKEFLKGYTLVRMW